MHAPALVAGIIVTVLIAAGCGPAQSSRTQPVSGALVTADGLRIIVAAMDGGCDRAHLTASERPVQVMLSLSIVTTVPRGAGCALVARKVTLSATLRRPLWGRRLTDASTGRPVRYFDGRRLFQVAHLPAGYRFSVDTPSAIASAMPPSAPVPWTRVYQGPRGATRLDVTQVPQPGQPAAVLPMTQQAEVGGHPAALRGPTEGDTGTVCCRAVTWSAGGYAFAVVSEPVLAGGGLLPYSVLQMIASSLRPSP